MRTGRRPVTVTRKRTSPARRGPSTASQVIDALPVRRETLRRGMNWALGGVVAAAIIGGMFAMELPQMVGVAIGEAIGVAGFEVRNIEVHGRAKMDREAVINIAMTQPSRAMPLVDLDETRMRLRRLGWVGDARVSRRLPDTLVIDISERQPTAIWQYQRRLALIDQTGAVIAPVDLAAMPDLPLVIGPGANEQVDQLDALMARVPAMKPLLAGATWVGQRRWDLRFHSGEVLALPEGETAAATALRDFARRDSEHRLLGQGFVRFDMRVPGRLVVRVSKEPGKTVEGGAGASLGVDDI